MLDGHTIRTLLSLLHTEGIGGLQQITKQRKSKHISYKHSAKEGKQAGMSLEKA